MLATLQITQGHWTHNIDIPDKNRNSQGAVDKSRVQGLTKGIQGTVQDQGMSIANSLDIPQFCTRPSNCTGDAIVYNQAIKIYLPQSPQLQLAISCNNKVKKGYFAQALSGWPIQNAYLKVQINQNHKEDYYTIPQNLGVGTV